MGYSVSRFVLQLDPGVDIANATEIINKAGRQLAGETAWKEDYRSAKIRRGW